jgi:hypothetical protein
LSSTGPIAAVTGSVFRSLSALRGKRIFHPDGVGFAATFAPHPDSSTGTSLLDEPGSRRAIVRLSRATGLPEPLPDVLGLAIRIPDAYGPERHQDFLLVTSSRLPVGRHLLLPARGFLARTFSSLLPYRARGSLVLVGALPSHAEGSGPGLASLRHERAAPLGYKLALASPLGGWSEVATLELGRRLPDQAVEELRFDPSNTGGGIELAGVLNRLRRPAYRGSQNGRLGSVPTRSRPAPRARRQPQARTPTQSRKTRT